jgi:hypothetical protein
MVMIKRKLKKPDGWRKCADVRDPPPPVRGQDRRGQLQDITPIAERPKEVETRAVPGHWGG